MLIYCFISIHIILCYSKIYNIFSEKRIITGYILYIVWRLLFMKIQGVRNKGLDCSLFSEITTICKYLPGINILIIKPSILIPISSIIMEQDSHLHLTMATNDR